MVGALLLLVLMVVFPLSLADDGGGCIPNWSCGEWSGCSGSILQRHETRICVDTNHCVGYVLEDERKCEHTYNFGLHSTPEEALNLTKTEYVLPFINYIMPVILLMIFSIGLTAIFVGLIRKSFGVSQ